MLNITSAPVIEGEPLSGRTQQFPSAQALCGCHPAGYFRPQVQCLNRADRDNYGSVCLLSSKCGIS